MTGLVFPNWRDGEKWCNATVADGLDSLN